MTHLGETGRSLRIGVDSGGTFTDLSVYCEQTGSVAIWKVPSTPADPSEGIHAAIVEGLETVAGKGASLSDIVYFGHGTTVATNALITGRGAKTGVVTTRGFRDLLELRRQKRASLYDLQVEKPNLLAARHDRFEVAERILFDGTVETVIVEEEVRAVARELGRNGIEAVAICLLFSFVAPQHEQLVKRVLSEELPGVFLSVSSEVSPEFREFERLSTTVVNAHLGPLMARYLQHLQARLHETGMRSPAYLTQSNGGVISFDMAAAVPARTVLSGPAAGVTAAIAIARSAGIDNFITFDMGGTSSDIALIRDGRAQLVTGREVDGHPINFPMVDINAVGAGGGSIARDDHGMMKVGPDSAGARPGPACYGAGNQEPTVTDANVALGVLHPKHLLDGRMTIDRELSLAALSRLGAGFGLSAEETAHGILRVVTANMAKAIRLISVERGLDPREFALVAFGGAGPIHASRLARELGIRRILVPPNPGTLCSLGLLLSDLRSDFSVSRLVMLDEQAVGGLETGFANLMQAAQAWFSQGDVDPSRQRMVRSVDMRLAGQSHEILVECPEGSIDDGFVAELHRRFEAAFRRVYGYFNGEGEVQVVTLRLEASAIVEKARIPSREPASWPASDALIGTRKVYFGETGGHVDCNVYRRERLGPGHSLVGPCVLEQMDTTVLLLPGQSAVVDHHLNILIEEQ